jgi:hypothetical protein
MPNPPSPTTTFSKAARAAETFKACLEKLDEASLRGALGSTEHDKLLHHGGETLNELLRVLTTMSPQRYGTVGITLGRADSIAKFFAFSFVATKQHPLAELSDHPFWGSGVYAIYYHGKNEPAYSPLSGSETPIYVGKADPADAFAESIEAQGQSHPQHC